MESELPKPENPLEAQKLNWEIKKLAAETEKIELENIKSKKKWIRRIEFWTALIPVLVAVAAIIGGYYISGIRNLVEIQKERLTDTLLRQKKISDSLKNNFRVQMKEQESFLEAQDSIYKVKGDSLQNENNLRIISMNDSLNEASFMIYEVYIREFREFPDPNLLPFFRLVNVLRSKAKFSSRIIDSIEAITKVEYSDPRNLVGNLLLYFGTDQNRYKQRFNFVWHYVVNHHLQLGPYLRNSLKNSFWNQNDLNDNFLLLTHAIKSDSLQFQDLFDYLSVLSELKSRISIQLGAETYCLIVEKYHDAFNSIYLFDEASIQNITIDIIKACPQLYLAFEMIAMNYSVQYYDSTTERINWSLSYSLDSNEAIPQEYKFIRSVFYIQHFSCNDPVLWKLNSMRRKNNNPLACDGDTSMTPPHVISELYARNLTYVNHWMEIPLQYFRANENEFLSLMETDRFGPYDSLADTLNQNKNQSVKILPK